MTAQDAELYIILIALIVIFSAIIFGILVLNYYSNYDKLVYDKNMIKEKMEYREWLRTKIFNNLNMIVCVFPKDNKWFIGYDNTRIFNIDEDIKRFNDMTINNVVIMGEETQKTLPNRYYLESRINVVFTTNKKLVNEKINDNTYIFYYHSIKDFYDNLTELPNYDIKRYYIIGGVSVFDEFLLNDKVKNIYATVVKSDNNNIKANKYIDDLSLDKRYKRYVYLSDYNSYTDKCECVTELYDNTNNVWYSLELYERKY